MNIEKQIRKLARSNYWQEVYNASKTCSGIYLFENRTNISGIQYLFLYWLRVYNMLYEELGRLEWENLDLKVIENDDRTDAFLYWRSKKIEKQIKKSQRDERKGKRKPKTSMKIYTGASNKQDGE